jgi:hypothetical protein
MEWKVGDKYFLKLQDGGCYNGEIIKTEFLGNKNYITIKDKFDVIIGIREDQIIKYELITKVNKVNNQS